MSDDKQPHGHIHKADLEHVSQQVGVIDATNAVSEMLNNTFLGGGTRFFGKTDFEAHQLNDMIDMVESANPDHLENAGKALWDTRDAVNEAAEELGRHIGRVDWEGESGNAFRDWAYNLVNNARSLAIFAEVVGTQITAAGSGLASVRKSMPPRDTRTDPKTVADIPAPKRVETNDEYAAAVKTEGHRQEAINQMNRLSSFYAVSGETLAGQEGPSFEAVPDLGVPRPTLGPRDDPGRGGHPGSLSPVTESGTERRHAVHTVADDSRSDSTLSSPNSHDESFPEHRDDSITSPDRHLGTEIDSVGTLPPEIVKPTPDGPPSVSGPSGNPGGPVPPIGSGPVPPAFSGPPGRTSGVGGTTGARSPISAQGRVGAPGGTSGGRTGRGPMGPVGRAAATGQTGARGASPEAAKSPVGRSITGGMPRAGGTAGGRADGVGPVGVGRSGGIVGGRPTTGAAPGAAGSRLPRGTVIGGESPATSRTKGERPSQRGVIGAPTSTTGKSGGQAPRHAVSNPDGVAGAPKGRASRAGNRGSTSGGTGLVRGPAGIRGSDRVGGKNASRRDESTGDETRSPTNTRRDVPSTTD
ncbi:hypothetical protein AB5J56_13240 [Streptomyces sp. R21]|uniref:Uncharacterized protein n=1 Tax=Streptomyces sp. R21 TaxID=3238627 RepID=A0AB39P550_9ACTN